MLPIGVDEMVLSVTLFLTVNLTGIHRYFWTDYPDCVTEHNRLPGRGLWTCGQRPCCPQGPQAQAVDMWTSSLMTTYPPPNKIWI